MIIKEGITAQGVYLIEGVDENGKRIFIEQKNVVVQGFFTLLFNSLKGSGAVDLPVSYFVVGSGTTAPMKADTKLETETFRKAVSSVNATSTKLTVKCSIGASEMVGTWREMGIYISGTTAPDSGTLLSRAAVNYAKSSGVQILVTYTLTIQ